MERRQRVMDRVEQRTVEGDGVWIGHVNAQRN